MKKIKCLIVSLSLLLTLCSCATSEALHSQESGEEISDHRTSERTELKEFKIEDIRFTLDDCEDIEFLNEEQKRTFTLATFVYMTLDLDGNLFFTQNNITPVYNQDKSLCHTGFTYESVVGGFKSVLSESVFNAEFENRYTNLNGEFLCSDGGRGVSADFDSVKEFIPLEITDEKAVFQMVALYSNSEASESLSEMTFDFEMNLTDCRWIMTKYEFWM